MTLKMQFSLRENYYD